MSDQILITICGRAGSKGFRNKNLKSLLGVPLVHYTLACAKHLAADFPEGAVDVCINTDSPELVALAKEAYPAIHVIDRPEELCGGTVGKFEVFKHSLRTMEARLGKRYDYLIDLDITSPLRMLHDALGALRLLQSRPDAELAITGCPSRRNPYFNMVETAGDLVKKVIEKPIEARQQAPKVFDMNASIYVLRTAFARDENRHMILESTIVLYEMYDTAVLDIDSEEDFQMMQLIAGHLFENNEGFAQMYSAAKAISQK